MHIGCVYLNASNEQGNVNNYLVYHWIPKTYLLPRFKLLKCIVNMAITQLWLFQLSSVESAFRCVPSLYFENADALLTLVWFRLMYIPVGKSTQMEAFQKMDRFAQLFWPTSMNTNMFQSGFLENLIVYHHGLWAYYQIVKMRLLIQLGWVVS